MVIEIKVPSVGESVTEALLAQWFKNDGDPVKKDEPLFVIETDKVTLEVVAEEDGVLTISGVKKTKKEEESANCIWSEITSGSFSRSLTLPDYVDTSKIKADYKNGILVLTMPKTEKAKPKEIEVKID